MSHFADAIARLTIDKDFARATRLQPERIATLYGLNAEEADQLRQLAEAAIADRAAVLRALLATSPDDETTLTDAPAIGVPMSMPTLLTMPARNK